MMWPASRSQRRVTLGTTHAYLACPARRRSSRPRRRWFNAGASVGAPQVSCREAISTPPPQFCHVHRLTLPCPWPLTRRPEPSPPLNGPADNDPISHDDDENQSSPPRPTPSLSPPSVKHASHEPDDPTDNTPIACDDESHSSPPSLAPSPPPWTPGSQSRTAAPSLRSSQPSPLRTS